MKSLTLKHNGMILPEYGALAVRIAIGEGRHKFADPDVGELVAVIVGAYECHAQKRAGCGLTLADKPAIRIVLEALGVYNGVFGCGGNNLAVADSTPKVVFYRWLVTGDRPQGKHFFGQRKHLRLVGNMFRRRGTCKVNKHVNTVFGNPDRVKAVCCDNHSRFFRFRAAAVIA